jgi:hypothetical protein
MKLTQLSVFLENKPGALTTPCRVLAQAGINIQTFALADTQQYGILRLVLQDWERAQTLLEKNGFVVKATEVVSLEVSDQPGALAAILEILEPARINVEYMYPFACKYNGNGLMLFRFDKTDEAIKVLQGRGVKVMSARDIRERLAQ